MSAIHSAFPAVGKAKLCIIRAAGRGDWLNPPLFKEPQSFLSFSSDVTLDFLVSMADHLLVGFLKTPRCNLGPTRYRVNPQWDCFQS